MDDDPLQVTRVQRLFEEVREQRESLFVPSTVVLESPSPASSQPGQGPRAGDQVTLTEIPDQAGSHERKYQDRRGAVP